MVEVFGKNILEVLTTGMYLEDSTIFREYIQNAADSIRKAVEDNLYSEDEDPSIDIELFADTRSIRISDNGYGVKKDDIKTRLLSIASSEKNEDEDMGYRGIGRLFGLAHCAKLIFKTSYPGENIETIMEWDAETMRIVLDDRNNKITPEKLLDSIITYYEKPASPNSHYFIVEMEGITSGHSDLLDQEKVRKYVAETAPIKFAAPFHHRTKIEKYAKEHSFHIPCYKVTLEGKELSKNYSLTLYENNSSACQEYDKIRDIAFKEFKASDGETLAWIWYGISAFEKMIPAANHMRGIRLRRHNIEVGDEKTLAKFFKEARGNYYFVGEVHLVHKDLRPNNRRDYIRDVTKAGKGGQKTILVEFEERIRTFFENELGPLYRTANTYKNAIISDIQLKQSEEEYQDKKTTGFINDVEKKKLEKRIEDLKKKAEKGQKEIEKIQKSAQSNKSISQMVDAVTENVVAKEEKKKQDTQKKKPVPPKIVPQPPATTTRNVEDKGAPYSPDEKKAPLITDQLTHLTENERRIVGVIYGVINEIVPEDSALQLIQEIQDKLKNA